MIGRSVGHAIGSMQAHDDPDALADILCTLEGRIGGAFTVDGVSPGHLAFVGHRCPFSDDVVGRPSLCQLTGHIFGRVAADRTGYARVRMLSTIAGGAPSCSILLSLVPADVPEDDALEFYRLT